MIPLVGAFLLVVGLAGATVSATPIKRCTYPENRLPQSIVPRHYNLELEVGTGQLHYEGKVHIHLVAARNEGEQLPKNSIVLNLHPDVKVSDVIYIDMGTRAASEEGFSLGYNSVSEICRDDEKELLIIKLGEDLKDNDEGELVMSFIGKYRDDKTGIYKTEYKSQAGVISYQISTDFKSNKARRAFPCFDEPSFKATFEITLTHDPWMIALSNTPIFSQVITSGRIETKFTKTPRMSTYLVAFATGEFEHIQTTTIRGSPIIRAFTRLGKSQHAQFALETAEKAITELENYFNIAFPLEKLDLLSVVQHNTDATENWGLIVCNETSFLFDSENMSPISKGDIASTVIQAVTEQWFGNLVTLEWWDDLWLQEGFAGWMANFLIDKLYPKLQWELNYLMETQQEALALDRVQRKRAGDGANIGEITGDIIRVKSVAVIRLLHDEYVQPEQFKEGIRQYLQQNMCGNAEAGDLWMQLSTLSQLPVEHFIKSWTEYPGHPIVTASLLPDNHKLLLEQRSEKARFSRSWKDLNDPVRVIPVIILLSNGQEQLIPLTYILDQRKLEVDLPDWFNIRDNPQHWLKVNEYSRGFYRAHHSATTVLPRLERPCKAMQLSSADRIGLIDDMEAHHRSGLSQSSFFKVLEWFASERNGSVLGRVARFYSRSRLCVKLVEGIFANAFSQIKLTSPYLKNVGTSDGLGVADGFGLVTAYSILLEMNYLPLVYQALTIFNKETNTVAPIMRELVYKAVALYGSSEQRNTLQSFLKREDNCEEEINRINAALALVPGVPASTATSSQGVRERPEVLPERIKRPRLA